jgi:hypothetical protein
MGLSEECHGPAKILDVTFHILFPIYIPSTHITPLGIKVPREGICGLPRPYGNLDFANNLRIRIQESGSITIRLHCLEFDDPDKVRIRFYVHLHFQSVFWTDQDGCGPIFTSHLQF